MKKIVLLCASGMSTSMLVKKMQEAAKAENYDCEIAAYSAAEAVELTGTSTNCMKSLCGSTLPSARKRVSAPLGCRTSTACFTWWCAANQ